MLEYIVDGQIIEVDPKDKNLFLQKYPNAKEQKKDMSPDFQTPTTPGAVVEETAAPDMESKSDPGSGELQKNEPFRPVFSKTGQILNKPKVEKIGNNKDFEEFNFKEAYFSSIDFNFIKGWKMQLKMSSNICVPTGNVKFTFVPLLSF